MRNEGALDSTLHCRDFGVLYSERTKVKNNNNKILLTLPLPANGTCEIASATEKPTKKQNRNGI